MRLNGLLAVGASLLALQPARAADEGQGSEEIIVTASPLSRSGDTFSKLVEKVTRDQTLASGAASVGDSLKDVAGVTGSGFAPGASRPVIRGQDANRVLVAEDGVGAFDVSDIGPDHGIPVDPLGAQRIEVVRGPATLRYGSQAIGGVVNIINNRIPTVLPDDGFAGEAVGAYSNVTRGGEGALGLDGGFGSFAVHADGFLRNAGDYETPLGRQPNSFAHMLGGSLGGSYVKGNDFAGLAYVGYDGSYGLPADETFIDMHQDKYLARGGFDVKAGALERVTLDAGYGDYRHSEIDPGGIVLSTFLNTEFSGRAEAIFGKVVPASALALGAQYQHRDFSALGEDSTYLLPSTSESFAGYLFARFDLSDSLKLEAALRVEGASRKGTPADDVPRSLDYTLLSISAGLVWAVGENLNFGVTLSSVARAPNLPELFARGGHDGPQTFETGNPDLDLERANSLEATARYETDAMTLKGSLWASQTDKFIYGALSGRTCDEDGNCFDDASQDLKELFYLQREARFWGYEAEAKFRIAELGAGSFSLSLLSDYVHARFAGGEPVPRIPPLRYGLGVSYESDALNISVTWRRADSRDKTSAFETSTDGYDDLSASAVWKVMPVGDGDLTLSLVGRNLTDDVQRNAVSFTKDEVIQPGRDVRLVTRLTF